MAEAIIALVLLLLGVFNPLYAVAAGLFAVACNIRILTDKKEK